jgi:Flp pilus assembly protein TadG
MCLASATPPPPQPRRPSARPGAAAVEFALVGSVFFLVVLGTVEVGRALMVQHQLTYAARVGCRVGILPGKSNSDITTATVNALTSQGVSGESVTVQVNDGTGDAANAQSGDEITVLVSIPVGSVTWVPFPRYVSGSLSGQYTLRRE